MKLKISVVILFVLTSNIFSQSIVINEYINGFSQKREFVELLVIQNNLDLRGKNIRDYSSAGNPQAPLYFTYNSYWASIKSGTLIAITADSSMWIQDTSKSDYSITIKYNTADTTYIRGSLFNIATANDAVQVRNADTTQHIHGISHGTNSTNWLPSPSAHYNASLSGGYISGGAALIFTKPTIMTLSDFANNSYLAVDTISGGTPGQPNDNAGNNAYILSLRAASGIIKINSIADKFTLSQNYPNPFNPITNIKFSIPSNGITKLSVYNSLGQQVQSLLNGNINAGEYSVQFDGKNLNSGLYFYKLEFNSNDGKYFSDVKKLMLIK